MSAKSISYFLLPDGQYKLNSYNETATKLNRGNTYVCGRTHKGAKLIIADIRFIKFNYAPLN